MSTSTKRQILETLDDLPEQSLATVAEFVEFLRAKAVGGPITRLAVPTNEPRPYGLAAGEFTTPADFDEPLPSEILDAFEGR
ncbi:MAG: DUF2281 domain-containing protein [Polyangiaceae bacterium]|nr:DUF2281 domain-containing protein [Polyangiaceae bacterium]